MVIIAIRYFNKDFIVMARSEVEYILPITITHFYTAKYYKSIGYCIFTLETIRRYSKRLRNNLSSYRICFGDFQPRSNENQVKIVTIK